MENRSRRRRSRIKINNKRRRTGIRIKIKNKKRRIRKTRIT